MSKRIKEIAQEIAKSGSLTPEMVNVGGTLRPEQSTKYIKLITTKSNILSLITVDKSNKLIKDINVNEFIRGVLQRVPQGTPPSAFTSIKNVGKQYVMKDAQLFAQVLFDYLRDNYDRPGLENETAGQLADTTSRDITYLGFVGVADDYVKGDTAKGVFTHLNKGWPQIMKEAADTHKIDVADYITSGVVDWTQYLNAVVGALPDIYKSETCKLLMNRGDYEKYVYQVGNLNGAVGLLISGSVKQFLGYDILPIEEMPANMIIFTPMPNLCFGMNTNIERYRELDGQARCINYTYDSAFDFQVAVDDAAVIGWDRKIPSITSTLTASGTVGTAFSYTITGSNLTGAKFSATGLPSGLTINAATGVISGTPASGTNATHNVTITATNAAGLASDTETLVVTIAAS